MSATWGRKDGRYVSDQPGFEGWHIQKGGHPYGGPWHVFREGMLAESEPTLKAAMAAAEKHLAMLQEIGAVK